MVGWSCDVNDSAGRDLIRVRGARVNNLRGVDVDIPKRRLTVFTGVSGSGKSSLVFDTIAAESQRMINETYSAFLQGYMPTIDRPDVDRLEGLTPAIVVGQDRITPNVRSTVGTITDANAMLRSLFSRFAEPHIGSPQAYSFNVPSVSGVGAIKVSKGSSMVPVKKEFSVVGGMRPRCEGTGLVKNIDLAQLYDETKSLNENPFLVPGYSMDGWYGRILIGSGFFDPDKPIGRYEKRELHDLLYKEPTKIRTDGVNVTYEGLVPKITKSMLSKAPEAMQPHIRAFVERVVTFQTCHECDATRLAEGARTSFIDGVSIADACQMQITDLVDWVRGLSLPPAKLLIDGLAGLLEGFVAIGLGYLNLARASGTLSGGEAQRVKMILHLVSALTDVTYVFDEPSAGLHPHDIGRLNNLLLALRDKGNTILVVEHKPEVVRIADHVVDLGPSAGSGGGQIIYEGDPKGLRGSDTLTGKHLFERVSLRSEVRQPTGIIELRGVSANNLHEVDVDIPCGVLTVVTGVAGSGKSTLMDALLNHHDDVMLLDHDQIKGSRRSTPATFTGLLEPVRKAFAKVNGVKPALFSANSEGACPACNGNGIIFTQLGFMDAVQSTCEACGGLRFRPEVLEHQLGGRNIAQVLTMSVAEGLAFFSATESKVAAATRILQRLVDVGLGYLTLGQPLTTLSGGERQRLKLADRMASDASVLVLDEPTSGLHMADIHHLLTLLDKLVGSGHSVIVVEHHLAVIACADWIIDMGPGAGTDGGRVVFTGTPGDLIAEPTTLTGQHLARYLS